MNKIPIAATGLCLMAFTFSACKQAGGKKANQQSMDKMLAAYWEENARAFPFLKDGSMPLEMIERKIDAWAAMQ